MRKNMYNEDIIMINAEELVCLYRFTYDDDLKEMFRDFSKSIFDGANAYEHNGNSYHSIGFDVNKLDPISRDVIEALRNMDVDNTQEYIYLSYLQDACIDALIKNEVELALELANVLDKDFKGNPFACRKKSLLKNNKEILINYLLSYQDTNKNIESDKNILYYENGELYPEYNVEKCKTKSLKS